MRRKFTKEERSHYDSEYEYGIYEFYPTKGEYSGGYTTLPEVKGESPKDVLNQLQFMLEDTAKFSLMDWDTGKILKDE